MEYFGFTKEAERVGDTLRRYQQEGVMIGGKLVKISFQDVAKATGVNRPDISQLASRTKCLNAEKLRSLQEYINTIVEDAPPPAPAPSPTLTPSATSTVPEAPTTYKTDVELYSTTDFERTLGWCGYIAKHRKTGVMIGHPGTGKTTVLQEFAKRNPSAKYIDCWPTMIIGDLLKTIAAALGITLTGTKHDRIMQIVSNLSNRTDVVLIFDEAENLNNWTVKSFEVLRKVWDNTGTPVILAGTYQLENMLTRGGGRENLAQLYRRKYEKRLAGIQQHEAYAILREYNITPEAATELVRVAIDTEHGGMGNFVEILELCLEAAQGGRIDTAVVDNAKDYKLLY
jgi:DNA transposition AAA+ family ATPase